MTSRELLESTTVVFKGVPAALTADKLSIYVKGHASNAEIIDYEQKSDYEAESTTWILLMNSQEVVEKLVDDDHQLEFEDETYTIVCERASASNIPNTWLQKGNTTTMDGAGTVGDNKTDSTEKRFKVKITGLPPDTDQQYLELYFDDDDLFGDLHLLGVSLEENGNSAVIELDSLEAVEKIMKIQPLDMNGTTVSAEIYIEVPAPESEHVSLCTIEVTGPADSKVITDSKTSLLKMYFKNQRKSDGGKILDLKIESNAAYVTFETEEVAKRVVAKGNHNLSGEELSVKIYNQAESKEEKVATKSSKLLLTHLPDKVDSQYIELYFEDEEIFEEPFSVQSVTFNESHTSAVVEFEDEDAVCKLLEKEPLRMENQEIQIQIYLSDVKYSEPQRTIEVHGPPEVVSETNLNMLTKYFKNKKHSEGGEIVDSSVSQGLAYFTYETEKVARRVVERGNHVFKKCPLEVSLKKLAPCNDQQRPLTTQDTDAQIPRLTVAGIPPDKDSEFLTMLFENIDDTISVKDISLYDKNRKATIEFTSFESVRIVMSKRPFEINGQELEITEWTPKKMCTISVRGPNDIQKDMDMLELYFKHRKSGGSPAIIDSWVDIEENMAYFTYEDEKVARHVVQQQDHVLRNQKLDVNLCEEQRETTSGNNEDGSNVQVQTEKILSKEKEQSRKLKLTNLPASVDETFLVLFLEDLDLTEGTSDFKVLNVEHNPVTLSAVVEFDQPEVVGLLCERRLVKMKDKNVTVEKVVQQKKSTCTIAVTGLPQIDKQIENLEMYFKGRKSLGNSPIVKSRIDRNANVAYFTYGSEEVARRVVSKTDHIFARTPLNVTLYMENNDSETTKMIQVSNLPHDVNEEILDLYFDQQDISGDFHVVSVVINPKQSSAVIAFDSTEVVDYLLKKQRLLLKGKEIDIKAYVQPKESACTICVTGIPNIQESMDILYLYFKNKKHSGGGAIDDHYVRKESQTAYFTFENAEVARNVVSKDHTKFEKEIKVSLLSDSGPDIDAETSSTIKVSGVKDVRKETLQYYFQNKNASGGGDIISIKEDLEDNDVIYVQFTNNDDADCVAASTHTVEGHKLKASIYTPPPFYETKILIKGIAATTTKDGLFNFLEAKTGLQAVGIAYHEDEDDVVIVTMEKEPDFEKLSNACQCHRLEGAQLMVAKVPISSCVYVANLAPDVTEETVRYYFESTKGGGGRVDKVTMNTSEGTCLVYFEDYKVVNDILQKPHFLSGKALETKCYQTCLKGPEGNSGERRFILPDPVEVSFIKPQKIIFCSKSDLYREAFEKRLEEKYASVIWSTPTENVRIQCTLNTSVKKCFKLAKTWKDEVEECMKEFMANISLLRVEVLSDIWDKTIVWLKAITVDNHEHVAIIPNKEQMAVEIVGRTDIAEGVNKQIISQITSLEEELERERQRVSEDMKGCQPIELRLLSITNAKNNIEQHFDDLHMKIDQERGVIVFEGSVSSVRDAKIEVFELRNGFGKKNVNTVSDISIALYRSEEVTDFIQRKLQAKNIQAIWDISDTSLLICCTDSNMLESCVEVVLDSVVESAIDFDIDAVPTMGTKNWTSKVDEIRRRNRGKVEICLSADETKIIVCATLDAYDAVVEEVHTFIDENRIVSKVVTYAKEVNRLLEKHHKADIAAIKQGLQMYHLEISMLEHYAGFQVSGLSNGVEKASKQLQALQKRVKKRNHTVTKPGIAEHMRTAKGKDSINTIETLLKCIISVEGDDFQTNLNQCILASCTILDDKQLFAWVGDMTDLEVDVLVNPVDDKMRLLGGLGGSILSKGGKNIKDACDDYINRYGELKDDETFVSDGGNLNVKYITHISSQEWKEGKNREQDILEESVFNCLVEASKRHCRSIGIPAIGCGVNSFPPDVATKSIVRSVKRFFLEVQSTSVTEVYLCDMHITTVRYFTNSLCSEIGPDKVTTYNIDTNATMKQSNDENNDKTESQPVQRIRRKRVSRARGTSPKDFAMQILDTGSGIQIGKIAVTIVKGEIANEKVNVIVNTTADNLDLTNGAVSLSLLNAAGQELQTEVNSKYPHGLKGISIAVTSGKKLLCSEVFHTALGSYDDKNEIQCRKNLHDLVINCLDETEQRGHSSIAIPAIGTGQLDYPHCVVAEEMYKAVTEFHKKNINTSLQNVHFVVYHKDVQSIQAFENEKSRLLSDARSLQNRDTYTSDLGYDTLDASNYDGKTHVFGKIKVTVKGGDLLAEDAFCIVNSTNVDLDLSIGAVSQVLLQKGGQDLQADIDRKKSMMKKKQFVITNAPNLPSEAIMHIVFIPNNIKGIVEKCLKEAEHQKMKSIAFPALGAGTRTSGASNIAQDMVEAVKEFVKQNPKHLRDIRFVIFQKAMINEFEQIVEDASDTKSQKSVMGQIWKTVKSAFVRSQHDELQEGEYGPRNNQSDVNEVTFCILSLGEDEIDKAIKRLDSFVEKEMETKTFSDYIIEQFDDNQVLEVRSIANQHYVDIQIDQSRCMIKLCGIKDNFFKAYDKIQSFIKDAIQMDYMANVAQWYVIDITDEGEDVQPYERELNLKLETAYKQDAKQMGFRFQGKDFIVDFESMEEFPEDDRSDVAKVIRRNLVKGGSFGIPSNWSDMKGGNLRVVDLKASDAEYKDMEQKFLLSSQPNNYTITKIQRIQNVTLWEQFQSKRKQLEEKNAPNTQNERMLWHGTKADAVDSINSHGFNRSFCGQNAVAFGNGVYFAVDAQYSCSDTYSVPDSNDIKRMYYSRVLTGEFTVGTYGLRTPPTKPGGGPYCLYDSVIDDLNDLAMFIVFNDTQAYPEYLISFK